MHQLHNPCVPFVEPIYESVIPGAEIEIDGCLHHGCHTNVFVIELLSGPHHVFHMSFRFHQGEHQIVMNSSISGKWQREERVYNPFGPHDYNFHLSIHVHATHFDVHVHNRCVATFSHRFPLQAIQALSVQGDVQIHRVQFNGFPIRPVCGANAGYNLGHQGYAGCGSSPHITPQFQPISHNHNHDHDEKKTLGGHKIFQKFAKFFE